MKQYLKGFGTDLGGNAVYEWTPDQRLATLYDKTQAELGRDFLNRHSPDKVTPKSGGGRLFFDNFRLEEISEGGFVIAFESRTEAEWIACAPNLGSTRI